VLLSVVPLAFLIALLVIAGLLRTETERMAAASQRATIALNDSEAVRRVVIDAEKAAIDYTRAQRPATLAAYDAAIARLPGRASALLRDVSGSPDETARAARYVALTKTVIDSVLTPYMHLLQSGKKKEAEAFGRRPQFRQLGEAWDKAHTDFEAAERGTTLARIGVLQRDLGTLGGGLLAASVMGTLLTLLVTGLFGVRIARRLELLADNARRLGRGERTEPIAGADEIADLDRVYHDMTRRVQESLHAKEQALAAYERAHHVATTLQRALLPQELPSLPGVTFDSVYVPGRLEAQVGGDWYDALRLADGRVLITIGDVAGSGLQAAVIMAAMRQVIRGVAQLYADPATMIDAADRTLKAEHPDRLVTAIVAVFDPVARTLAYCSAGHPPPLMRTADGTVSELPTRGLPLGLRTRDDGDARTAGVPDGATVLFYTDGLVESTQDIIEGERRLREALADDAIASRPALARALYERVLQNGAHDDVAILALRLAGVAEEGHARVWAFDTGDTVTAQRSRGEFATLLAQRGMFSDDVFTSELIFGELLSNVVRYAPGEIEVVLDWSSTAGAILHVLDRGSGFVLIPRLPTDLLSERGRGLFLVWSLSDEFNVTKRVDGGSHVRVVLSRRRPLSSDGEASRAAAPTSRT
jgi:serine phosphatase RsbU (regulator of sigma subunit)/anti-sigma regulatory factor (Ser/Thr protein kinase)